MLRADGIFSEACVLTLSSDRHACGPEYLQTASVRFYGFITLFRKRFLFLRCFLAGFQCNFEFMHLFVLKGGSN